MKHDLEYRAVPVNPDSEDLAAVVKIWCCRVCGKAGMTHNGACCMNKHIEDEHCPGVHIEEAYDDNMHITHNPNDIADMQRHYQKIVQTLERLFPGELGPLPADLNELTPPQLVDAAMLRFHYLLVRYSGLMRKDAE